MDSQNFINLEGKNATKKRKFAPNITKALAKKSKAGGSNFNADNRNSQESAKKPNIKRARIYRKAPDSDEPRFIQGFSIFEAGLGCAEKSDRVHFERTGGPAADSQNSTRSSTSLVHELFDEGKPNGSLFSLRIPDALLYEGSPLEKSGKFGKIQILDSGETRLVIGDCFFRLTSPGLAPYSTDVVLVEEEEEGASGNEGGGGVVNLTSLGHIEQFVTAVPDLDQFTRLGR
ncbi:hypothetical protein ACTXT7_013979 [Hymenolepis weldensis]